MNPIEQPPEPTTRHLLDRHHAGDRNALGRLLERELPAIRELVRRHLGTVLRLREETGDMVRGSRSTP